MPLFRLFTHLGEHLGGLGRLSLSLPSDGLLTLAQVRKALQTALSALPNPVNLDDLTPPEISDQQAPTARGGGFSNTSVDTSVDVNTSVVYSRGG